MRALPLPDRADVRRQLEVALETYWWDGTLRGYDVNDDELDSLLNIYDGYDANMGAPSDDFTGPLLSEPLKAAIQSGYRFTQANRKLEALRKTLFHGVDHCPICGITSPRELDHHLPEATYRPLAIYVRNLVPLCHDCNQSKSAHVAQQANQRFIHPYFEALPDTQFVRATVSLANNALVIDFDIDPAAVLDDSLRARLAFQIERLKLNQRYQREINTFLVSFTVALADIFDAEGARGVQMFLARQASVEERAFHKNHWRPVALGALAAHQAFCDAGFQQVLPVNAIV